MTRTHAANALDFIRTALANRISPEKLEQELQHRFGIVPLQHCDGEAHSNAYIDNCMVCAPRWGFIGDIIKIT